jgi:hypothetical protein
VVAPMFGLDAESIPGALGDGAGTPAVPTQSKCSMEDGPTVIKVEAGTPDWTRPMKTGPGRWPGARASQQPTPVVGAALAALALLCMAGSPLPAAPPASNFDLSHWKLTLPIDAAGDTTGVAVEIKTPQLQTYTSEFFYSGPDGAMVFWCPVLGATTSGATAPRTELRELINPSNSSVNWAASGTHILRARCRVTQQPDTGAVIIGQVHSYPEQRLVKVQYDKGRVLAYVRTTLAASGDTKFTYTVSTNAPLDYEIKVIDGVAFIAVNGVTNSHNFFADDPAWQATTYYFKAGAYLQDNVGPATEGGRVSFYQLSATHPVATPVGAPRLTNWTCTGGRFSTVVLGAVGSNYVLQSSADLRTWVSLATNSSSNGTIPFNVPATPGPNRFYRAR